ncbi:TonB-dependent receptor domain-containing protein [Shimwellia pseudoproteus]|uniref:TonB-dependent receptor domain-containing protein n=1 Tax=Shimwellia pseudoproteus TaxID=570012 RepID=UPI0018ED371F|nr:TonB-dependent receptor [Shimwellia pseudoproteus]
MLSSGVYAQDESPTGSNGDNYVSDKQEDTLTVSAAGFPQQIADAPATLSVISAKEIENHGYRNITDALKNIPGVSIENPGGGKLNAQSVTIRGMTEQYVLFLINGKPVGDTEQAFYNGWGSGQKTNSLPPMSAIERIEVIRGPMSSLYGSAASGGVVNIITKTQSEKWSGSVTTEGSLTESRHSGNTGLGKFYLSGPLWGEHLGLSLYGSTMHRSEDSQPLGYPETRNQNLGGTLSAVLTEHQKLDLDVSHNHQQYDRTAKSDPKSSSPTGTSSDTDRLTLSHNIRWNETTETQSFYTRQHVETREKKSANNPGSSSDYRQTNLNSRTLFSIGNNNAVLGADYLYEEINHAPGRFPGSRQTDLDRWQYSGFGENEWRITDDLALTVGLRYDKNQKYGSYFTPRGYLVYHLDEHITLKGGVSTGYKTPALKQASSDIVENAARGRAWDMGNDNLKPERSTNYELGAVWDGAQGVQLGVTTYYTRFTDKIDRREICSTAKGKPASCFYNGDYRQSIRQYVNEDGADLYGVESTLTFPIGEVNASLNYTYQRSKITGGPDDGKPFSDLPRQMANLTLDWDVTESINLWSSTRYRGKTQRTGNNTTTPSYMMMDMGASYRFVKYAKVYTGIYNLFDKQISEEGYGKVLDGRSYTLGLSADF